MTKIRTNAQYWQKYWQKNQILTKNIDSDLETLARLSRSYHSNPMIGYLNINSTRNKIVQLSDICKASPIEILCIDETKL